MSYSAYVTACENAHLVPVGEEWFNESPDEWLSEDSEALRGESACCCVCGDCIDEPIDARYRDPSFYVHEECQRLATRDSEMQELSERVEALCRLYEWDLAAWDTGRPGSWYATATRQCSACCDDSEDDCECESIKIRVADHGSCYCSEDISLITPSGNASGDDHTVEILERRLSR